MIMLFCGASSSKSPSSMEMGKKRFCRTSTVTEIPLEREALGIHEPVSFLKYVLTIVWWPHKNMEALKSEQDGGPYIRPGKWSRCLNLRWWQPNRASLRPYTVGLRFRIYHDGLFFENLSWWIIVNQDHKTLTKVIYHDWTICFTII